MPDHNDGNCLACLEPLTRETSVVSGAEDWMPCGDCGKVAQCQWCEKWCSKATLGNVEGNKVCRTCDREDMFENGPYDPND